KTARSSDFVVVEKRLSTLERQYQQFKECEPLLLQLDEDWREKGSLKDEQAMRFTEADIHTSKLKENLEKRMDLILASCKARFLENYANLQQRLSALPEVQKFPHFQSLLEEIQNQITLLKCSLMPLMQIFLENCIGRHLTQL